jgi:F-type H+-transporting ATPase subunit b
MTSFVRRSLFVLLLSCLTIPSSPSSVSAQSQDSSSAASATPASEPDKDKHETHIGRELAKESNEAAGVEDEENANLKHSSMVKKLAVLTGGDVHKAHLLAIGLNFAIIVLVVVWYGRKVIPGALRRRSESIQLALEEARAASQDASRRLSEIENRLRQLDVEIGRMQASAEKEGEAEEARIRAATEDDIRKVVEAAEQEIVAAAKQARREITAHTADLAIALAHKQINVDASTDQVLVRAFASKLSQGGKDGN